MFLDLKKLKRQVEDDYKKATTKYHCWLEIIEELKRTGTSHQSRSGCDRSAKDSLIRSLSNEERNRPTQAQIIITLITKTDSEEITQSALRELAQREYPELATKLTAPRISMHLRRLTDSGFLTLVAPGRGSTPATYKLTEGITQIEGGA